MIAYTKIKKSDLLLYFRSEFGEESMKWAIFNNLNKQDIAELIDEKRQYEECEDEVLRKRIRNTWAKRNKNLLEAIERFL